MRIYLDSNVFRDLEKPENKVLYELILADKKRNYYCFSEAHIQDLVRDATDRKLSDMDFMETIVENNCWYYDDKNMQVRFSTPREYYGAYDWNFGTDILTSDETFSVLIRESFRAIPLNWKDLVNPDELPTDFPDEMRAILLEPVTMLDFMEAMLSMTEELSAEQSRFKNFLQYLHRVLGEEIMFERLGIKGYNGKAVTDWEAFSESFRELVYQRASQKELYHLMSEMLFSLDIYGIIKGKPRKQKFMSLLNDGKHAYYAGHAHILVTSDADMIAKVNTLYRIWNLPTMVMRPAEFEEFLINRNAQDHSASAMFGQFERVSELPTIFEKYTLEEVFIQKDLPLWYLGEFNTLNCAAAKGNTYYYFSQYFPMIPTGTMTIELERVVNSLVDHFGKDELGQGYFDRKELENKDWKGREWRSGETGIIFSLNDGMKLYFFKAAPPEEHPIEG